MPYLGSTVFFVTLTALLLVAMGGWLLLVRALAPRFVDECATRFRSRPILTPLLGGVLGSVGAVVAIVLLSLDLGVVKLTGTILGVALLSFGLAGATGLAQLVGKGLSSKSDGDRPWFGCLKGALVLELSMLLPLFGWFFLLPVTLFGGVGAATQVLIARALEMGVRPAKAQHAEPA